MSTTTSTTRKKSNLRDLAEYIYSTGRGHEIITALDVVLSAGLANDLRAMRAKQEGGESV